MSDSTLLKTLGHDFEGDIYESATPGFAEHKKSFYGEYNERRPLAVVSPANAADVSKVVRFARDTGVGLVVRAGGHSVLGHSTSHGGLVLDLSRLKEVDVDIANRTAWAGGGVLAGEYTNEVAKHGLITGFGDAPSVGITGITFGGGVGYLHRKLGLTLDSVLAAEIVTADGEIREIDEENSPDLFWAIRGGGGNFGVVTRIKYRLHPVDRVVGGMLILPASPRLISDVVEIAATASDDLSVIAGVAVAPPLPFLPEEVHGQLIVIASLVHAGDPTTAAAEVGQFRRLATPLVDGIETMHYSAMYDEEEGPPNPVAMSSRSWFTDGFTIDDAESAIDALQTSNADMSIVQLRVLGGAVARVPVDATAFAHRDRAMIVTAVAAFQDPAARPEHEVWVDDLRTSVVHGARGAYANFQGDDSEQGVREIYPGATWDRLVDVKTKYDEENLFRSNLNVRPSGWSELGGATSL